MADGQERGYLTIEQVTTCLEEVEVTKDQVRELHSHLLEIGVDLVTDGGGLAAPEPPTTEGPPEPAPAVAPKVDGRKKPEIDLTVEPSLDSLRLYLRSIGKVS